MDSAAALEQTPGWFRPRREDRRGVAFAFRLLTICFELHGKLAWEGCRLGSSAPDVALEAGKRDSELRGRLDPRAGRLVIIERAYRC